MEDSNEIVRQRLLAIELARDLGNVAEACRRTGIDRTSFYEWRRRYERDGVAGLADRPPVHHSHPQTTPDELAERVAALALAHPSYGCNRLAQLLSDEGRAISSATIQRILSAADLGTRYDRWLVLDVPVKEQKSPLTPEQLEFIGQMNPCWRDRSADMRPGAVVAAGGVEIPYEPGSTIFVHFAIDVATGLAAGNVIWGRCREQVVRSIISLRDLFDDMGCTGQPDLCMAYGHYSWFPLKIRDLDWFVERRPALAANKFGAFDRFIATLRRDFSPLLAGKPDFEAALFRQYIWNDWINEYNTRCPRDGYPNYGASPAHAFFKV